MRIEAITIGKNPPDDVNVIIEVPIGGEPVKYEMDKAAGTLFVDRFLYTPTRYPGNYGFIPHTLSEDGDPCDVLVANTRPIIAGAVINVRPIGILRMEDEAGGDEKIVAVPSDKLTKRYHNVRTIQICRRSLCARSNIFSATTRILSRVNGSSSQAGAMPMRQSGLSSRRSNVPRPPRIKLRAAPTFRDGSGPKPIRLISSGSSFFTRHFSQPQMMKDSEMTTAKNVLKQIKDNDIRYVDLRFTDPRGKWQHVTFDVTLVDDEFFSEGVGFDGSSIAGWKTINESDMLLMPDPSTAVIDPFFAASTLSIICDVLEPMTGAPYHRDPRSIAKKAEAYLKATGIGDSAFFGPKLSFSSLMTCASPPTLTTRASSSTGPSFRQIRTRPTKAATSVTTSGTRAVISRFHRSIPPRTCAARCSRPLQPWASRSKSTITKSPRRSTNSASSSARSTAIADHLQILQIRHPSMGA